ncbi:MAG: PorP/SprF family type IX secretion system membrane protein [Bacteroidales bacterium]|nr:PorP/SprF family type IX secretion system membrane protein [Bacteroidales bacterium]
MLKPFFKIHLYFFLLIISNRIYGQNFFGSNLYNNIVFSNPSICDFSNHSKIQMNYRNQWPVADMYTTYGLAAFYGSERMNSNFGMVLKHDRQLKGVFTNTIIGLNYAYSIKTGYRSHLNFGLNGNYGFEKNDYSKLTFEFPQANMPENKGRSYPYVNTGVSYVFGRKSTLGLSVVNFLGINNSIGNKQEYHACYLGSYRINRRGNYPLEVEPIGSVAFKNNSVHISYGGNIVFSTIKTGVLLGHSNQNLHTTSFLLGILYNNFDFIYTYDLNLSGAISINPKMAAHEVTFLSKLQYKGKRKKRGAIKCPDI